MHIIYNKCRLTLFVDIIAHWQCYRQPRYTVYCYITVYYFCKTKLKILSGIIADGKVSNKYRLQMYVRESRHVIRCLF